LKLVESDFEVFLTVDRNLRHQQNLASSSLKFIVLVAANNQYDSLAPLIPQVKAALTKLGPGEGVLLSLALTVEFCASLLMLISETGENPHA
jgi:hypothetical protein